MSPGEKADNHGKHEYRGDIRTQLDPFRCSLKFRHVGTTRIVSRKLPATLIPAARPDKSAAMCSRRAPLPAPCARLASEVFLILNTYPASVDLQSTCVSNSIKPYERSEIRQRNQPHE